MSIEELVKLLEKFPPQTRVVVAGYQNGYNDITKISQIALRLHANQCWSCGAHALAAPDASDRVPAIYLGGYNPHCPQVLASDR
ncbi:MAG: hypothetical protein AB4290_03430 [Spirulina sp.]